MAQVTISEFTKAKYLMEQNRNPRFKNFCQRFYDAYYSGKYINVRYIKFLNYLYVNNRHFN